MQQYVCIDFENIFDYTGSFESDGDKKNMFCSNFHFKLKSNLDEESDEEIDDIDGLFYSPYKKPKLDEEEDGASTIVAVTANITSVISRTEARLLRQTFDMILNIVEPDFTKRETNLNQNLIDVNRQLGLTLYRLGHGASFTTLSQLFWFVYISS